MSRDRMIHYIYGDDLKGVGIEVPDGGVAIADNKLKPRIGDLVNCFPNSLCSLTKVRVLQKIEKDGSLTLTTARPDGKPDEVSRERNGCVITEIYDRAWGKLLYQRPCSDIRYTVRQYVKSRHVKQIELAERTGMTNSRISAILRGKTSPRIKEIVKLAYVLDMSPSELADLFLAE